MPKARTQKIKGTPYVYIERSFRVSGQSYPGHKRTYIGKMVDDTFVPNKTFHSLSAEEKQSTGLTWEETADVSVTVTRGRPVSLQGKREFRGTSHLFSTICTSLSLDADLERVFTDRAGKMLSLAFYLAAHQDAPLYGFSHWSRLHDHPYENDIPSPRSSELLGSITEDEIQQFLSLRVRRSQATSGWLAVDSTSVSSYSQGLSLVTRGRNKDHLPLEQINLLMVFDQDSEVPVFYRKLRGNITDVTTLDNTMHDLKGIGIDHASLVLDRGYYSEENVIHLLKRKHSFTLGTKVSVNFVKDAISEVRDEMMGYGSYDQAKRLFHASVPVEYSVPVRGRGPNVRYAYLHIYFGKEKEADDVASLMKRIAALQQQLESGKVTARRSELKKYFNLTLDANDQITGYSENQKGVNEAVRRCGFFALLTSEKHLDSSQVLSIYRKKDAVEKAFNNLKDRFSLKRTRYSRDDNFNGKVFLQFLALIITSRIRKVMKDSDLSSAFTLRSLLNEVDVIEYFTYRGRAGHWGEITEKQANILMTFGVDLPDEAWPKKYRKNKKPRTRRN